MAGGKNRVNGYGVNQTTGLKFDEHCVNKAIE